MGNRSGAPSHANITNAEMISGQQKKEGGGILIPIDDTIVSKSSTFGHQRRDTNYAQQLDVIPARQLSMLHASQENFNGPKYYSFAIFVFNDNWLDIVNFFVQSKN